VTEDNRRSGTRVILIMLALVLAAAVGAWFGAMMLEEKGREAMLRGEAESAGAVVSEGVLYEARAGDPSVVIAKDVGSGVELWRAEVGSLASEPSLLVRDDVVEVQIAGTPWMTLDRSTGEPVE
jgi:hypothetical protein